MKDVKVEAIKLKPFSGKPDTKEFHEWFELFESCTTDYANESKLTILKANFIGQAAAKMTGILCIADNYDMVIKKLVTKYANP